MAEQTPIFYLSKVSAGLLLIKRVTFSIGIDLQGRFSFVWKYNTVAKILHSRVERQTDVAKI